MAAFYNQVAATAQPQTASPFFQYLPSEIRQKIYEELWDPHSTRWHIDSLSVFPCVTDADDEDTRYAQFQASHGDDAALWASRLRSPWNTHWKCADRVVAMPSGQRVITPTDHTTTLRHLIAPLLVCKRMYIESVETLEDTLTFCFTNIVEARNFIAKHSPTKIIRNIDISFRLEPIFTELYFPGPDGEPQPHIGGILVTSKNNPWEDLCRRLSAIPALRRLRIRLDSEDLRGWHKRVNEKAFFEELFHVEARQYYLYLPDIPTDPGLQGLPGCYIEGDMLDTAPFKVIRGPRPNNWRLHLSRVSHLQVDRAH